MLRFGDRFDKQSDGYRCPVCGSGVERVHRDILDRWVSLFRSVHRYRCTDQACGWHGLLGRDTDVEAVPRTTWRTRVAWFVVGAASALAALQGARLYIRSQDSPGTARVALGGAEVQSQAMPSGHDFDGEQLPANDERVIRNPSPLILRRSCAWGVPGGNPYRGTVEQALSAARLPAEVVREISEKAERGWVHGQVEISRAGIQTIDHRRNFGKTALAMGFGNSLCFNMQVNFKPGHIEYASLYEATGNDGKTYTVMVPYVCQNVAVLGERYEQTEDCCTAPEPETWMMVLLGLGVLGWRGWHHKRSRPK